MWLMNSNYLSDYSLLIKEWNYDKNQGIVPSELSASSKEKVWWRCSKGHEWQSAIYTRTIMSCGCPFCSNQRVLAGYNDLASQNPKLAKIWNYEKNNGLKPEDVIYGGKKRYWWKCEKGHEWQLDIKKEYEIKCPFCAHRKLLTGFNDLATIAPEIASEFDTKKNGKAPEDVLFTLNIRPYWWRCSKGHSFKAPIRNRTKLGLGCPYCSNQKTMTGFNDILSDADMAKEWNYEKNKGLDPSKINHHSIKKVWWRCKYGHEWRMSPYGKQGCPVCNSEKKTSLPEKTVFFYVRRYFPDALENYSAPGIGKRNLDIFIPSNSIAIEYDGSHYHDDIERDKEKDKLCLNSGIILYRIREDRCPILDSSSFCIVMENTKQVELEKAIKRLLIELGIRNPEVNINQDLSSINELLVSSRKAESLLLLYPVIAKQWDYEKNGSITPDMVSAKSGKMFWWKCDKGHSYQARVGDKTSKKNNCPICANRRVLAGVNDLATMNPALAKQWDYEKNQLPPEDVVYGGTKEFWWKCDKGHSWKTSVRVRARGNGCPYCSHRKLLTGFNDLETIDPKLAKEWNHEKNGTLKPSDVFPSSIQKVWWKCDKCGHEWESSINNRSGRKGRGCPNCHKTKH